jgi:hypothetical protein
VVPATVPLRENFQPELLVCERATDSVLVIVRIGTLAEVPVHTGGKSPPASLKPMKPQVTDASWHLEISESLKTFRFGA